MAKKPKTGARPKIQGQKGYTPSIVHAGDPKGDPSTAPGGGGGELVIVDRGGTAGAETVHRRISLQAKKKQKKKRGY